MRLGGKESFIDFIVIYITVTCITIKAKYEILQQRKRTSQFTRD